MSAQAVVLTTAGATVEDVYRVAVEGAPVEVSVDVQERVCAARAVVERVLAGGRLVYGLNTGLGHLRDVRISGDHLMEYQVRMVEAHAGGVGPPLPDEDVRALMFARLAGMAAGGSGAHPDTMRTLVAMLNARVHPVVPDAGSVGAADLMHMAAVAMVAIGRGEARFRGEILPGAEALARAGRCPRGLRPQEGLAMINASGASSGLGALTVLAAEQVAELADTTGALTLEVATGNLSPFDPEAAAAKPFPGQIAAAAHVRELLVGSYLRDPRTTASVQDPLSFRVMPQVHGALREQIAFARRSVAIELNAKGDNPLVSIDHDRMLSTGNFHPMVLALAFDALRVALAHVGMLAERRMNKIIGLTFGRPDRVQNGADADASRYSVAGLLSYSAAALVAELKHLAAPATLGCPPLDRDVEDHATLAPLTVMLARRALRRLESVLAIEALLAVDALDNKAAAVRSTRRRSRRGGALPELGVGTRAAYEAVHRALDQAGCGASAAVAVEAVRHALTQ